MARALTQQDVIRIVRNQAGRFGLDPEAVLRVAYAESGIRPFAVGDSGTSFGPWQLHVGGALPRGRGANWAGSRQGVLYALRQMGKVAAGLQGDAAVEAIVRKFERPADPTGEIQRALAAQHPAFTGMPPGGAQTPSLPAQSTGVPGGDPVALARRSALEGLAQTGKMDLLQFATDMRAARKQAAQYGGTVMPPSGGRVQGGKGFVLPLKNLTGGSEFNMADPEGAPSANGQRFHAAKDWFSKAGSVVRSPVTGRVVDVQASRGNSGQIYGGVVKIQAPDGRVFVFRHVDPRQFKVGTRVNAGTPIARVSAWTGGSTHAHIEIWKTLEGGYTFENMIDPMSVFGAS